MYRVEVVTPNFKKVRADRRARPRGRNRAGGHHARGGRRDETVTVTGDAGNNITLDSQAISRGLDEQQLHDLPRNSRDIQSFLLLNPNVVGGFDDMQFLGAKTYGVSYIQDGQASTNAIFGTVGNSAPGLDAISEVQVLSNSYSAEYGGLAGVIVTTKRGGLQYRGTGFYDFNSNSLNALTYNQTLAGVDRNDPLSDTHEYRWGASIGGPLFGGKLFFYGNYEGSNDKAIYGGGRSTAIPTQAMRAGDFRGTAIHPVDPLTGEAFPDQVIPAGRIDPAATKVMNFFYPLPNQGTAASGYGIYQQFLPETRNAGASRHSTRFGTDEERLVVPPGQLSAPQSQRRHVRGGERADQHADSRCAAQHGIGHRRLDENLRSRPWSMSSARATTTTSRSDRATSSQGRSRPNWVSKAPRAR